MHNTKIEWCDSSWNPVTGCFNDCEYCYARKIANRFGREVLDRSEERKNGLHCLYSKVERNPYPYIFEPTLHAYRFDEPQKWTKPRTIFVCSMADLFGEWVPDEWIKEVFEACKKASQHRYLFLTKNPKRYAELYLADKLPVSENMYYGISITNIDNAENAKNYIGGLPRKTKNFLSVEPLLEDIFQNGVWNALIYNKSVNWVIIGAETGGRKNKIIPEKKWINDIVEICDSKGIPIFMKDSLIPIVGEENMRRDFPWDCYS